MSARGQIVIPKFIRDITGLHSGSQLLIHLRSDHTLELSPVQKSITHFFGQGSNKISNSFDVNEAIEEAINENLKS
ncbi:MAG: AbrB/MazE/SpoVT family DNA-binding domain-containing protein [Janthinobacterium lividum]